MLYFGNLIPSKAMGDKSSSYRSFYLIPNSVIKGLQNQCEE
uniref:Uncharacterized protein n=1 Tax=Octopus bimaculoides TaxID=37653 RepID=A0A0L8FVZ4_OCTBM